ncbi:MAG: hypothetical protein J1E00_02000 [Oscillospiraceae bacterium]|nr:hypothetical protein [Oscillospiraceae bacterium]
MMQQTETLRTVTTRYEIDARLTLKIAENQTARRAKKEQEKRLKPSVQAVFSMAGAQGLGPWTRGFGVDVDVWFTMETLAVLRHFSDTALLIFKK